MATYSQSEENPAPIAILTHPRWRFTEKLIELTTENYHQWLHNLKDILTEHEFSELITPKVESKTSEQHKAVASFRRIITKSITQGVINKLGDPTIFKKSPQEIIDTLTKTLDGDTTKD
ncbi:unnamed protein product [Agarophyton chilense]